MTAMQLVATICCVAKLCWAKMLRKTKGIDIVGAKTHTALAQPSRVRRLFDNENDNHLQYVA